MVLKRKPEEKVWLQERRWQEIQQFLDNGGRLAIVPVGSVEQHGFHLPLGTDSMVAIGIAEEITPADAPEVEMPVYDERGMESVRNFGLGMYMEDPLTTANLGKIFVE